MIHRRLMTLILGVCVCLCAHSKVFIVAAGVADYPGTKNDLRLPVSDVTSVVNLYKLSGDVDATVLTNSEATAGAILSAIEQKFANAGPDDIAIFVFSGHGYKGGFMAYDKRLSYNDVRNALKQSSCNNKIVYADACFSGKITGTTTGTKPNDGTNFMFFLSSRGSEESGEKRLMKNGIFTTALIKALRGHADIDHDRVVTARELFDFVSKEVQRISRDNQHPVMWGNFNNNMPVIRW